MVGTFEAGPVRADISVQATVSPQRVHVGQPLTLVIDIKGTQNVAAPTLDKVDGFDVQYVAPSTQVSIANGQISASVQHRYSLMPKRPGLFVLGPFVIDYEGKHYETNASAVDIVASSRNATPQPTHASKRGWSRSAPTGGTIVLDRDACGVVHFTDLQTMPTYEVNRENLAWAQGAWKQWRAERTKALRELAQRKVDPAKCATEKQEAQDERRRTEARVQVDEEARRRDTWTCDGDQQAFRCKDFEGHVVYEETAHEARETKSAQGIGVPHP
jgi:hypothetical protein